MADIEYSVEADTKGAVSNINNLEKATDNMVGGFSSLDKKVEQTGKKLDTLNTKTARVSRTADSVKKSLGDVGSSAGQASVQLQQFIGQIQGGQNALLALSQQAADIGIVMGAPLVGALVAIGTSILGIGINALSTAGAIDTFLEKLKELSDEELAGLGGQKQQTAIKDLNKGIADTGREIDKNASKIEELRKKEEQLEKQRDEARSKGFAGAVESSRIKSIQKEIEGLTIANQDLTESRDKDIEKLKILNDETIKSHLLKDFLL